MNNTPTDAPRATNVCDAYQILRLKDVCALLKRSRSMLYLDINPTSRHYKSDFPKPIRLSENTIGWRARDIFAYIDHLTQKPE